MNLVPVNMTIKEKIQRLMDGEVFYNEYGSKIFYDENSKGIPCWVWDDSESDRCLRLVVEVSKNIHSEFKFLEDDRETCWKHARPATKEELFDE